MSGYYPFEQLDPLLERIAGRHERLTTSVPNSTRPARVDLLSPPGR